MVMSIGIFDRIKKSKGYAAYQGVQAYREKQAQERYERRPAEIARMKRETQFLQAKSRLNRAKQSSPSPFRSFITGPPTMSMGGAFGFSPERRTTRRGKHRKRGGRTITIRV